MNLNGGLTKDDGLVFPGTLPMPRKPPFGGRRSVNASTDALCPACLRTKAAAASSSQASTSTLVRPAEDISFLHADCHPFGLLCESCSEGLFSRVSYSRYSFRSGGNYRFRLQEETPREITKQFFASFFEGCAFEHYDIAIQSYFMPVPGNSNMPQGRKFTTASSLPREMIKKFTARTPKSQQRSV